MLQRLRFFLLQRIANGWKLNKLTHNINSKEVIDIHKISYKGDAVYFILYLWDWQKEILTSFIGDTLFTTERKKLLVEGQITRLATNGE